MEEPNKATEEVPATGNTTTNGDVLTKFIPIKFFMYGRSLILDYKQYSKYFHLDSGYFVIV